MTDSFRIAEEHIGHPASLPWFRSLVNWYSDDKNDNKEVKELWSVFDSGKLCTDCMSGFIEHALSIGLVKPDWPVVTDQQAQCGQDFGSELNWGLKWRRK